jgi:class 3 adenylate cyclase/tetratricopeptide (TPR) repeat protein
MPSCSKCGKVVDADARFCPSCGQSLSIEPLRAARARKRVTVVFSDITGSTSLGEQLDPETVKNVLSRYAAEMTRAVEAHGGMVEKFIGDAVVAVFGVPAVHEDDALRGVRAAADIGSALEELNLELARRFGVTLQVRTGVNTGEVVVREGMRHEGYVVGDAVNVAARLEQAAEPGEILLGHETYLLVREAVEAEPVPALTVKGKSAPVAAFRLLEVAAPVAEPERGLDSSLVGRRRELSQLRHAFDLAVNERRPRLVTVLGAPGVGKSRLAGELISGLRDSATVLRGRCLSYGEGITYWPLAEVVKEIAAIGEEDTSEEAQGRIAALLVSEDDRRSIARAVNGALGLSDARVPPEEIFWAVRRLFETIARNDPIVMVLDDLHWAEPTFLDLIEYLVRSSEGALLLLCLARLDLRELRPGLAVDEGNRALISLQPLGKGDSEELVRNMLGEAPLPEDVSARITGAAGGNPLFAGEMLRMLVDEGLLERDNGVWRVIGDISEVRVPATIEAVLADRLDHLESGERDAVERASVIGEEFWPGAVTMLSPAVLRAEVPGRLEALERKELVVAGGHAFAGEEAFKFSHILVRDVAYGGILKEARSELHERFADWLETKVGERVTEYEAILGYHLDQAYRYREELGPVDDQARLLARRAAGRLASAGMRAAAGRADAEAISLLSRAASLLPRRVPERLELLPIIGESLEGTANHARAKEIYAEALEEAIAAGHRAVEGRARLGRAHVDFVTDPSVSLEEIVEKAKEALAIFEEVGEHQALAKAWRLIGEARAYQGRAAEGEQALGRALDHLDLELSQRDANATFFAMGMCLLEGPVTLERALAFSQERLNLARQSGRRSLEADMLHLVGIGEGRLGRLEPARQALADSTAINEELGLRYMGQWSRRSLGQLELAAEELESAEQALRRSYEVLDEMGLTGSLAETAVPLADAFYRQGRFDEAARLLDKLDDDGTNDDASVAAPLLMVRAKLATVEMRYEDADDLAGRALELVEATDWACLQADTLLAYSEVLSRMDCASRAIAILRRALQIASAKQYVVASRKATHKLEELGAAPGIP